ncbi:MAG: polysaccharide biosynthesis tyrosine autokinase [Fuerstiella sp.]
MDSYTQDYAETQQQPVQPNQGLHALLRFLRVVRRQKMILVWCLLAAVVLAVIYYKRTPKQYESTAKLMVRQVQSASDSQQSSSVGKMLSDYRELILSDTVLTNSVNLLDEVPPELNGVHDATKWPGLLRGSVISVSATDESAVLDISTRSVDPEATASLIRALIQSSSEFMEKFQQNDALENFLKLDEQREEIESKLFAKEKLLLESRKACGDIATNTNSEEPHPLVGQVNRLSSQLSDIRQRRLEIHSMLESSRQLVATNSDLSLAIEKLKKLVGSEVMSQHPNSQGKTRELQQDLQDELGRKQSEFLAARKHFGSGHAEMARRYTEIQSLQSRIQEIERGVIRSLSNGIRDPAVGQWLLNALSAELYSMGQYERSLSAEFSRVEQEALALSDQLAAIQVAEREVETLRQTHASLLTRVTSINVQPDGGDFRVASLTEPLVPTRHAFPIITHVLAGFSVIAVALGLGVIYVVDLLDDRLRSPEEVREQLNLPVLGIIRKLPPEEAEQGGIYVNNYPQTTHAEGFRTLKTSITLSPMESRCIAVTSSEQGEGKTTTTVNLAASYAQTGVSTLLIDADMRRPGLSRLLEVKGQGGMSEVLRAEGDLVDVCRDRIVTTDVNGLDVLPCGPRMMNAGMLLSMPTLAELIDWAMSQYDQVIIDCPPVLPVSDALIVGRYVDGIVFVMNPDKTHRRNIVRAVDQVRGLDLKIIGVVANTSLSDESKEYGYKYGYEYGRAYQYESDDHDDEYNDDHQGTRIAA